MSCSTCTDDCRQGRDCPHRKVISMEQFNKALVKYSSIVGISFIFGMVVGEHLGYKKIVDDCRILQATRLGERVIKCNTI